jgi:hypothetical protein
VSGIEELAAASQEQHRRYHELFGLGPVSGDGMRGAAAHVRDIGQQVKQTRDSVLATNFSTAVMATYGPATRGDHTPFEATATMASMAASATDTSAQVIVRGANSIADNARTEAAEIAAVPDPDSPEGQLAILSIIGHHQSESARTVTSSAAEQQALAQRLAAGGGNSSPALQHGAPALAPDDRIVGEPTPGRPQIQMVDNTTGPAEPQPSPGAQPQIGPFPVPPQVAAHAPASQPVPGDPTGGLLMPQYLPSPPSSLPPIPGVSPATPGTPSAPAASSTSTASTPGCGLEDWSKAVAEVTGGPIAILTAAPEGATGVGVPIALSQIALGFGASVDGLQIIERCTE